MTRKPSLQTAQTFAAELRKEEAALARLYGALFLHWRECRRSRCRRARGCRGEARAYFTRWWRALCEEQREERRALLREVIGRADRRLSPVHERPIVP